KLWAALTGGDFTYHYWAGRRIESDWRPGSPVRNVREDGGVDWQGEGLRAEPPPLLSYTFRGGPGGERPTRATFERTPVMGKVKLTLVHDEFEPGSPMVDAVGEGWPAILAGLKSLLERGTPLFPSWRRPEGLRA